MKQSKITAAVVYLAGSRNDLLISLISLGYIVIWKNLCSVFAFVYKIHNNKKRFMAMPTINI